MSATTRFLLLGATAAAVLSLALPARADTLTVNSDESYLKLEVFIEGTPIATAQLPGSDVTHIGGTLEASFAGGNITFGGGSNLDFQLYDDGNTDLLPDVGGGTAGDPGTGAPADIGLTLDLGGLAVGPGAVRLAFADVTGGPESIVADQFDASNLTLELTAGSLDVNLSGFVSLAETVDISGNSAINTSGGTGYTTLLGSTRYVVIPVNLDVVIPVDVGLPSPLPITARFTGQIVTVPEPSALVLLGIACGAAPAVGYRRLRRRS